MNFSKFSSNSFDGDRASVEVVPAESCGAIQCRDFAEVVPSASALGHSAIGYRRSIDGFVVLNPTKTDALSLGRVDDVIVIKRSALAVNLSVELPAKTSCSGDMSNSTVSFEAVFSELAEEQRPAAEPLPLA